MRASPPQLAQFGAAFLLLASLTLSGCGVALRSGPPPEIPEGTLTIRETASERCVHGTPGPDSPFREPLPGPVTDAELLPYLARFAPEVRRTAVAAGLEPLLARLMRERMRMDGGPATERFVSMRQEMSERIDTLETQLTAMEFECDCVRGLLYEVLGEYEEVETDRQLELTILSLAVGAGISIIAAAWDLANNHTTEPAWADGPLVITIAGAVAATGLGAAVLVRQPREIVFVHEHNMLGPIVMGADPDLLYPTFIFRLLDLQTASGDPTPREGLVATYSDILADAVPGDRRGLAEEIVYGAGGVYDPPLLAAHQDMLQELGATLDSFARDIDLLSHTIAIALEDQFDHEDDAAATAPASE